MLVFFTKSTASFMDSINSLMSIIFFLNFTRRKQAAQQEEMSVGGITERKEGTQLLGHLLFRSPLHPCKVVMEQERQQTHQGCKLGFCDALPLQVWKIWDRGDVLLLQVLTIVCLKFSNVMMRMRWIVPPLTDEVLMMLVVKGVLDYCFQYLCV